MSVDHGKKVKADLKALSENLVSMGNHAWDAAENALDYIVELESQLAYFERELDEAENAAEDAQERAEAIIPALDELRSKVDDTDTSVYLDQPVRISYTEIVNELTRIIGEH